MSLHGIIYVCNYFKKESESAAYFLFHSIINLGLMVPLCWNDTIYTLTYPHLSFMTPSTLLPTYIQISLHLSHIICLYDKFTNIDWIHHITSSLLIGTINLLYTYGPILNYALFFMCGLPGGIDYFLLFLNKFNLIESLTEKTINRYLNMYCRLPFMILWMGISYVCYRMGNVPHNDNGEIEMPIYIILIQYIFIGGNVLYFTDRVVANHAIKSYIEQNKKVIK